MSLSRAQNDRRQSYSALAQTDIDLDLLASHSDEEEEAISEAETSFSKTVITFKSSSPEPTEEPQGFIAMSIGLLEG